MSKNIDVACGSGSLLLTVGKHLSKEAQKNLEYYGQEMNTATYNLCRMNLLLHNVRPERMTIKNGDTLAEDWPEDPDHPNEGVQFDAVVMNPPYSLKNWNRADLKVSDPRFELAGTLPPSSKGDFAFLLHGLFHLGQKGTMAILLPHGVLFRGASEGEIRKRLLEKNYIDAIIGLPSNLFTNTGIPVVVLILKKNRHLGEPVLFVDASQEFTKEGKQNVLREKDIARIVDTYTLRRETEGYSCLASLAEIKENDYNLNIPRYVSSREKEIPHDVDAHLLGGIPVQNVEKLTVLQSIVPEVLRNALRLVREGYVELVKPLSELTEEVLADPQVTKLAETVEAVTNEYTETYWEKLRSVTQETNVSELREQMLADAKQLLNRFQFVDTYDGYQIIAEVWNRTLDRDAEKIAASRFYELGRSREPNWVTKGSGANLREEQDGWVGSLVPNETIERLLFASQLEEGEEQKARLQKIDAELAEWVETAKEEDSEEGMVLSEALKKDSEGEPGDTFENRAVKAELKKYERGTKPYEWLQTVERLLAEKSALNREIRNTEKERKEAVQERILTLTDEEIDQMVYEKWFGTVAKEMVELSQSPLLEELKTLELLHKRYADTLEDLDWEIRELESEFEKLATQLVVTK